MTGCWAGMTTAWVKNAIGTEGIYDGVQSAVTRGSLCVGLTLDYIHRHHCGLISMSLT